MPYKHKFYRPSPHREDEIQSDELARLRGRGFANVAAFSARPKVQTQVSISGAFGMTSSFCGAKEKNITSNSNWHPSRKR
jgi:hypothetical protein